MYGNLGFAYLNGTSVNLGAETGGQVPSLQQDFAKNIKTTKLYKIKKHFSVYCRGQGNLEERGMLLELRLLQSVLFQWFLTMISCC